MRFLVDNMLSPWIAVSLTAAGYDALHVRDFQMSLATDSAILTLARDEDRAIISADLDFTNLLALRQWRKPSLLLLRDIPQSREAILTMLLDNLPALDEAIKQGSIISFRHAQVRIRPLPILG